MRRTVVLNVAGLSPSLLGRDTPCLNRLGAARIRPICPAVTCSTQATYLTGNLPAQHGIVGNGWYFRDLAEILFWRQSNRLVQGDKLWHAGRAQDPGFTCANSFWWYNMATDVDWSVTPRPVYCADGRKLPDCYTSPSHLRDEFNSGLGQFPLFRFWGPAASFDSSLWIAAAARSLEERYSPTLHLVYLPHLDYVLQKEGPQGNISGDLREVDALCGSLTDFFSGRDCRVIVLSEYGISKVDHPVHPNRILRQAGFLATKTDHGRDYLDPCQSRAFAVADHQVAHVYVRQARDVETVKALFNGAAGVEAVLDGEAKREWGLDHERAGELVLVAAPGSWFTYYFWEEDGRAPDYARTVNIHAKPGYDPCELFFDPQLRFPKLKVAAKLLKQRLGFRTLMDVIALDAKLVRGSHGRIPEEPKLWPVLLSTDPALVEGGTVAAVDVYHTILRHVFDG